MESHMLCLARKFLGEKSSDFIIPIEGACPKCKQMMLWGDLIRKKRGCYANIEVSGILFNYEFLK